MNRTYLHDDCPGCLFLGNLREGSVLYDLYYCPQRGDPTVIARFGDEPHHYASGMGSQMNPLKVARTRAMTRGFVRHIIYHPYDLTELWETKYEDLSKRDL